MANRVFGKVRELVSAREQFRCLRCGAPVREGQAHHRRSRSIRGPHCHCNCNLVWLCGPCHTWIHAHPTESRKTGWIVSRYAEQPSLVLVDTHLGTMKLNCDASFNLEEQT